MAWLSSLSAIPLPSLAYKRRPKVPLPARTPPLSRSAHATTAISMVELPPPSRSPTSPPPLDSGRHRRVRGSPLSAFRRSSVSPDRCSSDTIRGQRAAAVECLCTQVHNTWNGVASLSCPIGTDGPDCLLTGGPPKSTPLKGVRPAIPIQQISARHESGQCHVTGQPPPQPSQHSAL